MQSSPQVLCPSLSPGNDAAVRARRVEYVIYQVVTVGAILLVLGTVWIF